MNLFMCDLVWFGMVEMVFVNEKFSCLVFNIFRLAAVVTLRNPKTWKSKEGPSILEQQVKGDVSCGLVCR